MENDYSSFQLKDKIAIVTGPSQGIGRAIALGLAKAGANLVLAEHPAMHPDDLKKVKAEIEALGRKAVITLTDISKVDQVRAMVDEAMKTFGRLDILVNNAGWTCNGPALETTEEDYDKTVEFNREGHLLRLPGCGARDDPEWRRTHHQHRLQFCRLGLEGAGGVLRREG